MEVPCKCECHRNCHACGRPFIGPNDYHTNCGDTISTGGSAVYHVPYQNLPWPGES